MATELNAVKRDGVLFQTTDATGTAAVHLATRASKVYWVEVKVLAGYSDQSAAAAYWLIGCFRTNSAGTLAQVGSTQSVITAIEDTGAMACTMAASGTDVVVTVTGVAGTNIQWLISSDVKENDYIEVT